MISHHQAFHGGEGRNQHQSQHKDEVNIQTNLVLGEALKKKILFFYNGYKQPLTPPPSFYTSSYQFQSSFGRFSVVFWPVSLYCLLDKIQNHIGNICMIFLHCAFLNVSSNCLLDKIQNQIGCTCYLLLTKCFTGCSDFNTWKI